jgi:hypothetical protein
VWIQLFLHDGGTAFSRHQFRSVVEEIAELSNYNFILRFEIDKMLVRFAQMVNRSGSDSRPGCPARAKLGRESLLPGPAPPGILSLNKNGHGCFAVPLPRRQQDHTQRTNRREG